MNSKRLSCQNLYCVFLLIPYFPVYKFQKQTTLSQCKCLSVKRAEQSRGEIRMTHFNSLSGRICFFTGKQSKINLIFAFKEFRNYFFLPSIWIFMFFFCENC